jgi:cysteine desulfurase / selenocysteine lyase
MNDEIRALFPITERAVYLNHAAVAPPPTPALEAIQSQLRDVAENGSMNFRAWLAVKERACRLLAGMLGARPEQVAFMRNTSDALSTVANGIKWRDGDNLVTFSREFPSNAYPWLRLREAHGVEVRMCSERDGRIDLGEMIGLMDNKTRLVAISHVQFASGFRMDLTRLGEAARAHDALLVVDVIQALGVIPTNVEAELIDVAAGGGHKWLLTPEGVGFLYLSDRARNRIQPTLVGWTSVPNPEDHANLNQPWNRATLAWETGTFPTSIVFGLEASLRLLTTTGVDRIAAYLADLTDYLCDSIDTHRYRVVSSRLPGEKSQIVSIQHKHGLDPMALYVHLKKRQIVTAPRGGGLRISPHFYNTRDEIDRLLTSLP